MQEKCELYLGNCVDVLSKLINDGIQVDLTITSPPYDNILTYQGTCTWNFDIFKEIANKLGLSHSFLLILILAFL